MSRAAVHYGLACVLSVLAVYALGDSCLMISEVNSDNPKLDTQEFVELYHSSAARASLDGYSLVFYNGNNNLAYRVLDLRGHATDDRGFFLIGSVDLRPRPSISLPPNTVQNGPDAIVLYGPGASSIREGSLVQAHGLADVLVYATRRGGGAGELAAVLTPGSQPFIEDAAALDEDESIQRCWETEHHWAFRLAPPTPGRANTCSPPGPAPARIEELRLGGPVKSRHVEVSVSNLTVAMVLVVYDGRTAVVRGSADVTRAGEVNSVTIDTGTDAGSGAIALYEGRASDFPKDTPLSPKQPIDAFVFSGPSDVPNESLSETLTPGRRPYAITQGWEAGVSFSRCGVADWSRDSGVFMEALPTPGRTSHCPWPKICPYDIVAPNGTVAPPLPPWLGMDFLLNELNADTPGAGEDAEFIEIWHPSGQRTSLEGVWLLLINGQTGKPYHELSLSGYFTDSRGYFLIGSDKLQPEPSIPLPSNTVQNGPDAVALYRSEAQPSSQGGIPTVGLLDAVVYRSTGSDKEAVELTEALTPNQLPLLEEPHTLSGDESLSRCLPIPNQLSAFRVGPPTPMEKNVCPQPPTLPPPPEGVVINEVSGLIGANNSQKRMFVELTGPPLSSLHGLVLALYLGGAREAVPLRGQLGDDGLYLVNLTAETDAVLLCYGSDALCDSDSVVLDSLVVTEDPLLLNILNSSRGHHIHPHVRAVSDGPISLSRCSCCEGNSIGVWITSLPSPGLINRCPSRAFSSPVVDLCLEPLAHNWQEQSRNCSSEIAVYLEEQCSCGITPLYLQGMQVSCESGQMHLQGSIPALSEHQKTLIMKMTQNTQTCSNKGLVIMGVVMGLVALVVFAVALVVFHKRKQPQYYTSMELSDQTEL
ncbi:uncharacterized protein LOC114784298 [Denticeps clupeoides]|uniref:LTD domain-containing protein n=1 Tax=Denticeps clupeoides TaxID=299321 RepID=A0AAY4AIS5_9TELE|nr:uncharacterized protein LOC114784298 [Denticeps clupeoides]